MRMYLSSFDIGTQPDELVALVGERGRVALILNALDHREAARKQWLKTQTVKLIGLGFSVEELDLREHFGCPVGLMQTLRRFDAVWVNGGNAFILRRAMKESGFDILIGKMLERDDIVYAGFSAAAVVASDTLQALDQVSDPGEVPAGYNPATVWEGLRLLPFALVVHFDSDHPESNAVITEMQWYESNRIPYRTLRDGEALVVDGPKVIVVGRALR